MIINPKTKERFGTNNLSSTIGSEGHSSEYRQGRMIRHALNKNETAPLNQDFRIVQGLESLECGNFETSTIVANDSILLGINTVPVSPTTQNSGKLAPKRDDKLQNQHFGQGP